MVRHKPFTKTEMKILVYNKVRSGMSYEQACKQLSKEIDRIIENDEKFEKEEKKARSKMEKNKFKDDFKKLTNGKKR